MVNDTGASATVFPRRAVGGRLLKTLTAGLLVAVPGAVAMDIRISDLSDIDFGAVPPTAGQLVRRMDFCVSLSEPGRYSVTALGTGRGYAFELSNGHSPLPVEVRYSDRPGRRGVSLVPGVPETGLKGRKRKRRSDCNRPTASIEVVVEAADLIAAPAGRYGGVLTLTVSPE